METNAASIIQRCWVKFKIVLERRKEAEAREAAAREAEQTATEVLTQEVTAEMVYGEVEAELAAFMAEAAAQSVRTVESKTMAFQWSIIIDCLFRWVGGSGRSG